MKWLREDLRLARSLMPGWPPERWISIAALFVSGLSLLVAADARREESTYRRLYMKPKVAITFSDGETCAACDTVLATAELVMEGTTHGRNLQFHVRCFQLWDDERRH